MNARYKTLLGSLCILSLSLMSCEDGIKEGNAPILTVSSDRLLFTAPTAEIAVPSVTLTIENTGNAELIITEVRLEEQDDVKEVSLVDEADWTASTVTINPTARKTLTLNWSPLDQAPDECILTISSNAGTKTVVVETVDLDPVLILSADGERLSAQDTVRLSALPDEGITWWEKLP